MYFRVLFLFFTLCLPKTIYGADKLEILKVSNDKNSDITSISVSAEEGSLQGLESRVLGAKETKYYTASEISKGVALYTLGERAILILSGSVDARTQEGNFTMKYLSNAIFSNYDSCDFLLRRDSQGWYIENAYTHNRPIENVKIITWTFGVSKVAGICK